jgi:hypothetical protein
MNQYFPGFPVNEVLPQYQQPKPKFKLWPVFVAVGVMAVFGVWAYFGFPIPKQQTANISDSIRKSTYQAVFLTTGQVYFGKLEFRGEWLVLLDVYYLQANGGLQQGQTANSNNFQLVKLGSEIHGPEDIMYLEKGNILFWENISETSQVLGAIQRYKK